MAMRVAMRAPAAVERTLCECETTFVCDFDPHTLREQWLCDRRGVAARKYAKLCMQEPSDRSLEESHYDCLNFVCGFFCGLCEPEKRSRAVVTRADTQTARGSPAATHTHTISHQRREHEKTAARAHTHNTQCASAPAAVYCVTIGAARDHRIFIFKSTQRAYRPRACEPSLDVDVCRESRKIATFCVCV